MHRLRPFILLAGTLLSLLIVAAFVVSAWWSVSCRYPGLLVGINSGLLMLVTDAEFQRQMVEWGSLPEGWSAAGHKFRLHWGRYRPSLFIRTVPLWVPFLAVAVPTLLAWRLWPKPVKPGHCRCGYDLHGNESGVCPECGRGAPSVNSDSQPTSRSA